MNLRFAVVIVKAASMKGATGTIRIHSHTNKLSLKPTKPWPRDVK